MPQSNSHDIVPSQEARILPDMCVIQTLESMLSHAFGESVYLDMEERVTRRDKNVETAQAFVKKLSKLEQKRGSVSREALLAKIRTVVRIDSMNIKNQIEALKKRNNFAGRLLDSCSIVYASGDLELAQLLAQSGHQVAVFITIPFPDGTAMGHAFHIDFTAQGKVIDLSDDEVVRGGIQRFEQQGQLNQFLELRHQLGNSWNILGIVPKMSIS